MSIEEMCAHGIVTADRSRTLQEYAMLMGQNDVGLLLVSEEAPGGPEAVGVVTDRDIVVEVVVNRLDPETILVGEIMAAGIATVREQDGVFDTMQLMRRKGVRRLPVVDDEGALVGIIAIDDLIQLLAEKLGELSKLIVHEQVHEAQICQ